MDLLAFERKLDQTIMRKRVDIQEALKRPMKVATRAGRARRKAPFLPPLLLLTPVIFLCPRVSSKSEN